MVLLNNESVYDFLYFQTRNKFRRKKYAYLIPVCQRKQFNTAAIGTGASDFEKTDMMLKQLT